jgi:hypothetical protein
MLHVMIFVRYSYTISIILSKFGLCFILVTLYNLKVIEQENDSDTH